MSNYYLVVPKEQCNRGALPGQIKFRATHYHVTRVLARLIGSQIASLRLQALMATANTQHLNY